jgi:hypothetical protein
MITLSITVKFLIGFIITNLMIYLLRKDYNINWEANKVFTASKYSTITRVLGILNVITFISIFNYLYKSYGASYIHSHTLNVIIEFILIPIFCIAVFYFALFYWTFSQVKYKHTNKIKDK